ncbi:hypothetical protein Cyrtocomes_01153 [Candidatus Cyrtobacter comes]|uniref:Uncharacterized protein n=1 Tax=Candidatus Cyrtobacter comes TaxID=675776 RepID=A0ABU5LA83_9RICK|nr:hypothetical protein [Candidatus Cyrtobacter comes]MDZ5762759.1 hypothetical protein [Candidatus Cyrtobacter comes]
MVKSFFKLFLSKNLFISLLLFLVPAISYATGKAVAIPFLDDLGVTVKEIMNGSGKYIVHAAIIGGGVYATVKASSPAPIIFAIVSSAIFQLFITLILQ